MALRRYKMYAGGSATANIVDSMQSNRPGVIKQIHILNHFDSITDNAMVRVQISKSPVGDWGNAASGNPVITQVLAEMVQWGNFVTSGLSQPMGTFVFDCNDKLTPGEALYLNVQVSGTATYGCSIIVVVDE